MDRTAPPPGPQAPPPSPPATGSPDRARARGATGFWAGYGAWLGERRGLLLGLFLLELLLLVALFLLTRTPEDPFAYGVF